MHSFFPVPTHCSTTACFSVSCMLACLGLLVSKDKDKEAPVHIRGATTKSYAWMNEKWWRFFCFSFCFFTDEHNYCRYFDWRTNCINATIVQIQHVTRYVWMQLPFGHTRPCHIQITWLTNKYYLRNIARASGWRPREHTQHTHGQPLLRARYAKYAPTEAEGRGPLKLPLTHRHSASTSH